MDIILKKYNPKEHDKLYSRGNSKNTRASNFYKENVFEEKFIGKVTYRGTFLSECLMERDETTNMEEVSR